MNGPLTLSRLIEEQRLLWCYCRDCCRERDADPETTPLPGSRAVTNYRRCFRA